jgi:hypothetical protein
MILGDRPVEPTTLDELSAQRSAIRAQIVKLVEDGSLAGYDDHQLVEFMQGLERETNMVAVLQHLIIAECQARDLPGKLTQSSMTRVLTQALRISVGEASRRVQAAEQVGDRASMTGQPMQPVRPVLAVAQRAGDVTPEQVHIIAKGLAGVDRAGFDPADITAGEQILTRAALEVGPKDLQGLTDRVVEAINPDGSRPCEELHADRRFFELRPTPDGMYRGEFRLTGTAGAKLQAVLGPLAKPRIDPTTQQEDLRHHGQRRHDALEDVCDRLLRAGTLPDSGGTPATVIVTVSLQDLTERTGYGQTTDGTLLPTAEVLRLADQADILPTVLTPTGAVLAMGRSRRVATPTQTLALVARDSGCSFPGCDHPPEWCERHHIVDWIDGGLTNLDNLTLLCRFHHHNFASHGWTCALNADGLPAWTPPKWVDREQKPRINTRITARQLDPSRRNQRCQSPARGRPA